jgi:succinate dehydrogenase / fumarate reductase cytochrome b subunit
VPTVIAGRSRTDSIRSESRGDARHATSAVALHVSDLVSLPDHLGSVDPAPAHRHRVGIGSILLAWWLVSVAAGGEWFATTHAFIASPVGMLLLFGWSIAFFYHLCNGVRHLAWDAGYGFELRQAYRSGYAVLAATALLTVLTWTYVLLA